MARISRFFAYLHSLLIQVPQHGYHNISRVIQPQMRHLSEGFTANSSSRMINKGIELRPMKPKETVSKRPEMSKPQE
ncbi:uncharacterized protein PV06_04382 [Exophiala oligosperma]|uniref:Uncharacterized protein n=1 Tax=Exophiala oligosperma TaxID=215243 RepID=A0A0D2ATT8_9EURO|nr:uncharacterized protein PV06_04382 [Exophiala oligosperma]KIW43261.1 hypothetical protein PV06_04382 [Exophiala oligosperma]